MARGRTGARTIRLRARGRSLGAFFLLLRALALVVGVQLTGAPHLAMDVASLALDVPFAHEDCSREAGDETCPPGCPNCHCTHAGASDLPPVDAAFLELAPPDTSVWTLAPVIEIPQSPDVSSVYRPPKSARSSLAS